MNQKMNYLLLSSKKFIFGSGKNCPSCGSSQSKVVDRKYLVTALRRCENCKLLFRTPTTSPDENASFYQENYSEGFTTEMPDQDQLDELLSRSFVGGKKDYSRYIAILEALGIRKGAELFDFRCSCGYGSWQYGSHDYRKNAADSWHKLWGLVHPNFLDKEFYDEKFNDLPSIIGSTPCDLSAIQAWSSGNDCNNVKILDLSGGELFFSAKNIK